jgi:transcriptional regulator with XRE-family HTH domain
MATKRRSKAFGKPKLSTAERFGSRLRVWRREQGHPLKRVAHDLDVSVSVVSQWERGLRFPSVRNLDRIAKYMEVPVCTLLYDGKATCPHKDK